MCLHMLLSAKTKQANKHREHKPEFYENSYLQIEWKQDNGEKDGNKISE